MLVASVDYPNKLIYLGVDSTTQAFLPIDVYTEVRDLRASTPAHRLFSRIISGQGNAPTGPTTRTPRRAVLVPGARIVPYDLGSEYDLDVIGELISEDGLSGSKLFDRSSLSPGTLVNINYEPRQVEIIEVQTGGITQTQIDEIRAPILTLIRQFWTADESAGPDRYTRTAVDGEVLVDKVRRKDLLTNTDTLTET